MKHSSATALEMRRPRSVRAKTAAHPVVARQVEVDRGTAAGCAGTGSARRRNLHQPAKEKPRLGDQEHAGLDHVLASVILEIPGTADPDRMRYQ